MSRHGRGVVPYQGHDHGVRNASVFEQRHGRMAERVEGQFLPLTSAERPTPLPPPASRSPALMRSSPNSFERSATIPWFEATFWTPSGARERAGRLTIQAGALSAERRSERSAACLSCAWSAESRRVRGRLAPRQCDDVAEALAGVETEQDEGAPLVSGNIQIRRTSSMVNARRSKVAFPFTA